jgi:hypothetical protein
VAEAGRQHHCVCVCSGGVRACVRARVCVWVAAGGALVRWGCVCWQRCACMRHASGTHTHAHDRQPCSAHRRR